jgi:hypothetical protein
MRKRAGLTCAGALLGARGLLGFAAPLDLNGFEVGTVLEGKEAAAALGISGANLERFSGYATVVSIGGPGPAIKVDR